MKGTLYVVATPIGNLDDMTFRAVRVLSEVDLIAAEDTRVSRVLLERFGIKTPLASCHKFNEADKLDFFLQALAAGKNIALISDAGTPCLSDPGHRLVGGAAAEGVDVVGVCGACAAVTAVSVSGFDASSFLFIGFWPRTAKGAAEALQRLRSDGEALLVFYESPKRIVSTLRSFEAQYPDARLTLCNDLTKKFERLYRGTPAQVREALQDNPHAEKGEYTCVVENRTGTSPAEHPQEAGTSLSAGDSLSGEEMSAGAAISLEAQLTDILCKTGVSLKEAVQILYEKHHKKTAKKEIYAASLRLKGLFTT